MSRAAIMFALCIGCSSDRSPEEKESYRREIEARVFAEQEIKKLFNFPAEVSIPFASTDIKRVGESDDFWIATSKATAKNAFGVKSEHNWSMTVWTDGKAWRIALCLIDGKIVSQSNDLLEKIKIVQKK